MTDKELYEIDPEIAKQNAELAWWYGFEEKE